MYCTAQNFIAEFDEFFVIRQNFTIQSYLLNSCFCQIFTRQFLPNPQFVIFQVNIMHHMVP